MIHSKFSQDINMFLSKISLLDDDKVSPIRAALTRFNEVSRGINKKSSQSFDDLRRNERSGGDLLKECEDIGDMLGDVVGASIDEAEDDRLRLVTTPLCDNYEKSSDDEAIQDMSGGITMDNEDEGETIAVQPTKISKAVLADKDDAKNSNGKRTIESTEEAQSLAIDPSVLFSTNNVSDVKSSVEKTVFKKKKTLKAQKRKAERNGGKESTDDIDDIFGNL